MGGNIMDKKLLALVGAAVLIAGLFLPLVTTPEGSVAMLLHDGTVGWEGLVVLALAVLAGALALMGQTRHVLWPGLAAAGFIAWQFFDFKGKLDGLRTMFEQGGVSTDTLDNHVKIEYLGWGVLAAGAVILIVTGILALQARPAGTPPAV
jgi:hypothetical protein